MLLSIISAMNDKNVIGLNNQLPWHLPADLQRFKQVTMGNTILMGRKTFESIGKPLPGRQNMIITRQPEYVAQGCRVVPSLENALEVVQQEAGHVFIIGGGDLYAQTIDKVCKMYLTIIHHDFAGDCFFPPWSEHEWQVIEKQDFAPDAKNKFAYTFLTLSR